MKTVYATSKSILAAEHGSLNKLISEVEDKIAELEGGVEMSTDIAGTCDDVEECGEYGDDPIFGSPIQYTWAIEDTFGAPQAGVDVQKFETYNDLELYIEEHPEVGDRIHEGYAMIKEL